MVNVVLDNNGLPSEVINIYRAVGERELSSIIRTRRFSFWARSAEVKYFRLDFHETSQFAHKAYYDYVAVVEVRINKDMLDKVGDFIRVDPFLFKHGTVEIQPENLDEFNASILEIKHKDWR